MATQNSSAQTDRAGGANAPRVLIVGAGFAGLCMAIKLLESGNHNVTIVEKAAEVGGVWRENTYPGCACDIPAQFYSFSFELNPDWQYRYARQDEIQNYILKITDKYKLRPHIRFSTEIEQAVFDEATATWKIHTTEGEILEADVFVPAVGQLSRPAWPKVPGLESYTGTVMHSAQWDPSVDLNGKNVIVVGSGASAAQLVPEVAKMAGHLTLFQRTVPWVLPRMDRKYSRAHKWACLKVPGYQRFMRNVTMGMTQFLGIGILKFRPIAKVMEAYSTLMIRMTVRDPELRKTLRPTFGLGCRRILFTSAWLPAMNRANVRVVSEAISEITPTGVRTASGTTAEADHLILATGFEATDMLAPMKIIGEDGLELNTAWKDGATAYFGISVPKFPNMFILYGPNTNLGTGSIIYIIEAQVQHLMNLMPTLRRGTATQVRAQLAEKFDGEMQHRLSSTIWATCQSYYRLPSGRIPTNWPGLPTEYRHRVEKVPASDYVTASVTASTKA